MFAGGNVTVYVSSMDRSVAFYTESLGLKLLYRFGDHWALIHAAPGLSIGLHPSSDHTPSGRKGSMVIGLELQGSIDDAVKILESRGVQFPGGINRGKAGAFAGFEDPDGNALYLTELNQSHVKQGEGEYRHS